jgi:hypothetical protein
MWRASFARLPGLREIAALSDPDEAAVADALAGLATRGLLAKSTLGGRAVYAPDGV